MSHFTICKTFNDATSNMPKANLDHEYGIGDTDFEEYFFNFAFSIGSSINAKKFVSPTVPLYQQHHDSIESCEGLDCSEGCW